MNLPARAALAPLGRHLVADTEEHLDAQKTRPERVLQFGEGNFLRAFVDWMLSELNRKTDFNGRAVLVQPISSGLANEINAQDGLFTLLLRGLSDGKPKEERVLVESVSRAINPYAQCFAWLETAKGPDFRFIVSNTTEAGIALHPEDSIDALPSPSFPGKLTQWLYARYLYFEGDREKGVIVLPCELILHNGRKLRELVFELSAKFELPDDFSAWVEEACVFTSTLVDRIVTGYPRAEAQTLCEELGYEDKLLVAAETYHLWVIESPKPLEDELPFKQAGLNVIWTQDATPYRERKVRILNGAHTAMTLIGLLGGFTTVGECMDDKDMSAFVSALLFSEVTPNLPGDAEDHRALSHTVLERFKNPYVRHELTSIALNSVSKFQARLLGSLKDELKRTGTLPERICLALAALLVLYRPREEERSESSVSLIPRDEAEVLTLLAEAWRENGEHPEVLVQRLISDPRLLGEDLTVLHPGLVSHVAAEVTSIREGKIRARIAALG